MENSIAPMWFNITTIKLFTSSSIFGMSYKFSSSSPIEGSLPPDVVWLESGLVGEAFLPNRADLIEETLSLLVLAFFICCFGFCSVTDASGWGSGTWDGD